MIAPDIIKISSRLRPEPVDHRLPFRDARIHIIRQDDCLSISATATPADLRIHDSASGLLMQVGEYNYEFSLLPEQSLTISTAEGNDTVRVESALSNRIIIDTGPGDDTIHVEGTTSLVMSGPGDDSVRITNGSTWIDAGPGNDRVLAIGQKQAIIHGGAGDDFIYSAAEHNFLQAGTGNDTLIIGGGTSDVEALSGENLIVAGPGKDVLYLDTDFGEVIGANEQDDVYAHLPPAARTSVVEPPEAARHLAHRHTLIADNDAGTRALRVDGTVKFKALVEDDLRTLRTSPTAYTLLRSLDDSGTSIQIVESPAPDNAFYDPDLTRGDPHISNGNPGIAVKTAVIHYNPAAMRDQTPAIVMLYHELCHAWNHAYGTVLSDHERQAVGLPTGESPFDFDADPSTPPTNTNPAPFNENALRKELGLAPRISYP
ncbi:M91 family zinc metallopeptidase [Pseudomonas rubra]|uniref:M91 family zinc metallopeptidase n=1 Tax=Pseudomonas rubra TaxID=2942627 RepID=A0ABT5P489_9PSED|nr:M91 family zinc metallopeptidase [Pseudomonas rubra]MDD1013104.1 M91 family zinc metallopeptidase [Pseudomonas rubra]MDD1036904.1 M91 family zinc metallopeptidase [Pseudomonas rubra]MDD1154502.1 M91 family zinc metallopeptidase [Pseudomonas rubra]